MSTILGIQTEQPGMCSGSGLGTQLGPPIQVLIQPDDRLTSRKRLAPKFLTTTLLELNVLSFYLSKHCLIACMHPFPRFFSIKFGDNTPLWFLFFTFTFL